MIIAFAVYQAWAQPMRRLRDNFLDTCSWFWLAFLCIAHVVAVDTAYSNYFLGIKAWCVIWLLVLIVFGVDLIAFPTLFFLRTLYNILKRAYEACLVYQGKRNDESYLRYKEKQEQLAEKEFEKEQKKIATLKRPASKEPLPPIRGQATLGRPGQPSRVLGAPSKAAQVDRIRARFDQSTKLERNDSFVVEFPNLRAKLRPSKTAADLTPEEQDQHELDQVFLNRQRRQSLVVGENDPRGIAPWSRESEIEQDASFEEDLRVPWSRLALKSSIPKEPVARITEDTTPVWARPALRPATSRASVEQEGPAFNAEGWFRPAVAPTVPSRAGEDEPAFEDVELKPVFKHPRTQLKVNALAIEDVALRSVEAPETTRPPVEPAQPVWDKEALAPSGVQLYDERDDQTRLSVAPVVQQSVEVQRARRASKEDLPERKPALAPLLAAQEPVADPNAWRTRLASKDESNAPPPRPIPATVVPIEKPVLKPTASPAKKLSSSKIAPAPQEQPRIAVALRSVPSPEQKKVPVKQEDEESLSGFGAPQGPLPIRMDAVQSWAKPVVSNKREDAADASAPWADKPLRASIVPQRPSSPTAAQPDWARRGSKASRQDDDDDEFNADRSGPAPWSRSAARKASKF